MPSPVISLVRSGTQVVKGAQWAASQRALDRRHSVVLKHFVHPSLLDKIRLLVKTDRFANFSHADSDGEVFADELVLDIRDPLAMFFQFLTNQEGLFAAVKDLAGCDANIQAFAGRGYKLLPSVHFDSWHNDIDGDRRIGLSINLQPAPISGGEFQIRHLWSNRIHTFPAPEFGDAILFKIGRLLYHRVRAVEGPAPRFCYAGWFVTSQRSLRAMIETRREPIVAGRRARSLGEAHTGRKSSAWSGDFND